jgi:signal transduction histidine kinase
VSPRLAEFLDIDEKKLLTDTMLAFANVHPDDIDSLIKLNLERFHNPAQFNWEGRAIIRNKLSWVRISSSPEPQKNGDILWNGVVADITERIQVELELKLKNEELIKVNSEKDKFFSIIAHDLRSPFNGFLGLTRLMAEELSSLSTKDVQKIVETLRNSASNLYRLIENLLHWASMKQGLIHFEPSKLKLFPVVRECISAVAESANSKGIEISTDISEDFEVYADNNMLQTVIRNLLSNAVKFTVKGGRVDIYAGLIEDKGAKIYIKDSGIGMSSSMVDNIFRINEQTNRQGTDGEPSTGLGLLLCNEFIERHGSKIVVISEVGKGSEFSFILPDEN